MKILIKPAVLKGNSEKVDSYIDDFANATLSVKNTLYDLGNNWQGEDFKNFYLKMGDFISQLNKLEKSIQSYNDFIKKYEKSVSQLDDSYGKKTINLR